MNGRIFFYFIPSKVSNFIFNWNKKEIYFLFHLEKSVEFHFD